MAGDPTINPYAPPAVDVNGATVGPAEDAFPNPLFTLRQMLAAAVLGSVFAGVILLQANYRAMKRRREANRTFLFGFLATGAFLALTALLPEKFPSTPISIAGAFAFHQVASRLQGDALRRHSAANGKLQSNWVVFGITAGTLIAVLVIAFLVVIAVGVPDV